MAQLRASPIASADSSINKSLEPTRGSLLPAHAQKDATAEAGSVTSALAIIKCDSIVLSASESLSSAFEYKTGGGPRWTRTTYLRVISTALCQLS